MARSIVVDADYLFSSRQEKVVRLLSEFAEEPLNVDVRRGLKSMRVTAANRFSRHLAHEKRTFSVLGELVYASYHEDWVPLDNGKTYRLLRAYMNAFLRAGDGPPEEFAALHCDLDFEEKYKKSPHLHLWIVGEPLKHAHVPLNGGHMNQVTSGIGLLTSALRGGLQMIRKEVVERYCDHLTSSR